MQITHKLKKTKKTRNSKTKTHLPNRFLEPIPPAADPRTTPSQFGFTVTTLHKRGKLINQIIYLLCTPLRFPSSPWWSESLTIEGYFYYVRVGPFPLLYERYFSLSEIWVCVSLYRFFLWIESIVLVRTVWYLAPLSSLSLSLSSKRVCSLFSLSRISSVCMRTRQSVWKKSGSH